MCLCLQITYEDWKPVPGADPSKSRQSLQITYEDWKLDLDKAISGDKIGLQITYEDWKHSTDADAVYPYPVYRLPMRIGNISLMSSALFFASVYRLPMSTSIIVPCVCLQITYEDWKLSQIGQIGVPSLVYRLPMRIGNNVKYSPGNGNNNVVYRLPMRIGNRFIVIFYSPGFLVFIDYL